MQGFHKKLSEKVEVEELNRTFLFLRFSGLNHGTKLIGATVISQASFFGKDVHHQEHDFKFL